MENEPVGPSHILRRPRKALSQVAKGIAKERQMRSDHFGDRELFGEPAWDILLHIFQGHCDAQDVPIQSIALCSGLPMTSALRWLELLERKELVFAYHKEDGETAKAGQIYLRLSSKGYQAMAQYVARIAQSRQASSRS